MSFLKPVAKAGGFGLAGLAATSGGNKKPKNTLTPQPSMITLGSQSASMISKPQLY